MALKFFFRFPKSRLRQRAVRLLLFTFLFCTTSIARADLQFDVFTGFDGVVPEANWFPVICEVRNDGPAFNAFFEISSGEFSKTQVRRVPLELPTNTRKRIVVPVFSSSRYGKWDFRLIDEKGNIRAEHLNVPPRIQLAWKTPLVGALSRSVNGAPIIPKIKSGQQELQPVSARLQPELFPDNPIALEGLKTLYLNSEIALELKVPQRDALLAWLNGGGHLIVSVEQLSDIAASGWLDDVLPCELTAMVKTKSGAALDEWLRAGQFKMLDVSTPKPKSKKKNSNSKQSEFAPNPFAALENDETFAQNDILVANGKLRDGTVLASANEIPLVIEAVRGRGRVTLLTFNAEREPFLSWKNRQWFWVKIANVPAELYQTSDFNSYGGASIDGIFGSLIDSKQVRKLPLMWLLLLLVLYLAVIGPLDRFWLKKINRQMLTWITFPVYVVIFSVLIYWIGFHLRAGDSEFNELQVVDIFPRNEKAVLRGRTFASVYSPSNKRYALAGEQRFATLRGEVIFGYNGASQGSSTTVIQRGNNFVAEVSVPVWTSQLYVSDWLESAELPLKISAIPNGANWDVTIENELDRPLSEARVVLGNRIFSVGNLPANKTTKVQFKASEGTALKDFTRSNGEQFFNAVQMRHRSFGNNPVAFNMPVSAMAASFSSQLDESNGLYFVSPTGFDLAQFAEQGSVVLLAWDSGHGLSKPVNQFTPRRIHRDTLLRLVVPKENKL